MPCQERSGRAARVAGAPGRGRYTRTHTRTETQRAGLTQDGYFIRCRRRAVARRPPRGPVAHGSRSRRRSPRKRGDRRREVKDGTTRGGEGQITGGGSLWGGGPIRTASGRV